MDASYTGQQPAPYNPSILTPDSAQAFSAPPGGDNYEDEPPLMEGIIYKDDRFYHS
jgi:hypothetical protein